MDDRKRSGVRREDRIRLAVRRAVLFARSRPASVVSSGAARLVSATLPVTLSACADTRTGKSSETRSLLVATVMVSPSAWVQDGKLNAASTGFASMSVPSPSVVSAGAEKVVSAVFS